MHFYNVSPFEEEKVLEMDVMTFKKHIACIDAIQCRDYIQLLRVASYPNLKNRSAQEEVFNEYKKMAYPVKEYTGDYMSAEDFARHLGKMVNG